MASLNHVVSFLVSCVLEGRIDGDELAYFLEAVREDEELSSKVVEVIRNIKKTQPKIFLTKSTKKDPIVNPKHRDFDIVPKP